MSSSADNTGALFFVLILSLCMLLFALEQRYPTIGQDAEELLSPPNMTQSPLEDALKEDDGKVRVKYDDPHKWRVVRGAAETPEE